MPVICEFMSYRNGLIRHFVLGAAIALSVTASSIRVSAEEVVRFDVVVARASSSGSSVDKRLLFAKRDLLGTGYKSFAYLRGHSLQLGKGQSRRFSIEGNISGLIELKGVTGEKGQVAHCHVAFYLGNQKQAGVDYSVWKKGAPGIAVLSQAGGSAYIIIVRALQ